MAILQDVGFLIGCAGDGLSSSVTIDLHNYIIASHVLPITPSKLVFVSDSGGHAILSSSLSGTKVTVNFVAAPLNGSSINLDITLGF